jgi:uncharacterized membrane protein
MTDLGTVGGLLHSGGNAINARGDIAGWVGDETVLPYTHAMVRIDGVMTDLGTFGSTGAMANGINATGAVCGTTEEDDLKTRRGFVWQAGAVQMLAGPAGTGSIEARAINDDGVVVGQMHVPGNVEGRTVIHAFVAKDGVAVDLNTLLLPEDAATWVLEDATSVNNHGQIVGTGRVRATGETHAFGLTPVR